MTVSNTLLGASLAILSFSSLTHAQVAAPAPLVLEPLNEPAAVPDVALQTSETFDFGASNTDQTVTAQMKLNFEQDNMNILSLEKFSNALKSVDCDESMAFEFNDAESYNAAKADWTWVNEQPGNEFVLVANDERCSPEQRFALWMVSDVSFDDGASKISATAVRTNWAESRNVASKGSVLSISSRENSAALARRQDGQVDLNSDFTGLIADSAFLGLVQPRITLDCVDCRTTGRLDFEVDVDIFSFDPGFSISIFPRDISANVELALGISGNLTDPQTISRELVPPIPLAGIDIPGIATLGTSLTVDGGAEFTVQGEAELKFGARVEVPNESSAQFSVGFGGVEDDGANGWETRVTPIGPELNAQIDATASVFTSVGIKLEASVFDFGLEASLDLRAPEFTLTATAQASTEGACDTNQALGVGLKLEAGVNLVFSAGFAGEDPAFSPTLFEATTPLFEQCLAFGPEIGAEEPPAEEQPPVEEAPVEEAPVEEAPVEEAPVEAGECAGVLQEVIEGETCFDLSQAAGVSVDEFTAANPNINCDVLIPGTPVCFPNPTEAPPAEEAAPIEEAPACSGAVQRVVEGDSCSTLADTAGVPVEDFLAANPSIDAECTNLVLDTDVCVPTPAARRRARRHARELL